MPGPEDQPASPAAVVAYDDRWPTMFRQVADEVSRALAGIDHEIEHVGSTAVPGLAAKPILDLFAVLGTTRDVAAAIDALGVHGWWHEGDHGRRGRESFAARADLPYHHLYLVVRGSEQHLRQTRFRDILRSDEDVRAEYAELKSGLAPLLSIDRAAYTEGKTEFIGSVLRRHGMTTGSGDFELTMDELRAVARYAAESAQEVLPVFEDANRGDHRPRAALDAAWEFVNGANRTNLQRVTSLDAHRAANEASTEASRLAAQAAGDTASAAYLHPIAKAHQVGHILRAAANAARIAELNAGNDFAVGDEAIRRAQQRATTVLIKVLDRYPVAPTGRSRVAHLMSALDTSLRARR